MTQADFNRRQQGTQSKNFRPPLLPSVQTLVSLTLFETMDAWFFEQEIAEDTENFFSVFAASC